MTKSEKPKGKADNVSVWCAHEQIVAVDSLKPHPRNPNKHPDKQIRLLSKVIEAQGWRCPITISSLSGFIVRGHARRLAALKLGLKEVPVDFQHYENEEAELADLVADNRLSELAEMDRKMLREVLGVLDNGALDMELTGYDEIDVETLMATDFDPTSVREPDGLPPPEVEGEDIRNGRFLLVYTTPMEREFWCDKLGLPHDTPKVVLTVDDFADGK